ncbi:hypothetical protein RFI_05308 [Reticulomyxa filosa]|uniref:Uncharacterized protein n=1 Tax=Reticulomyxa filosa TaxID=46433 RepID=X6P157_RETFI|nr:hypothetical protein RFI_05308 [Reticulomyxa filosa]|eukprot:ETO31809.1 hypothetical protein RFI_05308 [Reticulomyxa filosa]
MKHMNHRDFLIVYTLIIQFCVLGPLWMFIILMKKRRGDNESFHWAVWCNAGSAVLCLYGLFVLMRGTSNVLHPYSPRAKFFTIQSLFLSVFLPSTIMVVSRVSLDKGHRYDTLVMREAYSAIISLVFCAIVAFLCRKHWQLEDCRSAQISFQNGHLIVISENLSYSAFQRLQNKDDDLPWEESHSNNNSMSFQNKDDRKSAHLLKMYSS